MSFMNNVNLYHLKYFLDAALENGISASARKNFVTQSAVSRAITSLEQSLGVELVIHRKNHFQLTEAGESILGKSQELFEQISELQLTASHHLNTLQGPLRFGCNQAIASHLLGPALVAMESTHPGIKPFIKLGNTDQIQQMLMKQELDFGIVVDDGEVENHFETKKIYSDKLLVVKSPHFKKKDLFKHLIVSRTQKGGFSQKFFRQFEKFHGEPLQPKLVVPSWQVIMDFAISGYGLALVPRFLCEDKLRQGNLEVVNLKLPAVSFDLCTIVRKNKALPKNAEALIKSLRDTTDPKAR